MASSVPGRRLSSQDLEVGRLTGSLARVNAVSCALVFGVVVGISLWLATLWLVARGGPSPGHTLRALGYALPGYRVSVSGAFVGMFWGFVTGFSFSLPSAWLYYRGVLKEIERSARNSAGGNLFSPARLQVPYFAAAAGLLCGLALFVATVFLVLKHRPGEPLGPHLGLLAEYLPGYQVSVAGGIIGFLYLLVIGGSVSACAAAIYNRLVNTKHPFPWGVLPDRAEGADKD